MNYFVDERESMEMVVAGEGAGPDRRRWSVIFRVLVYAVKINIMKRVFTIRKISIGFLSGRFIQESAGTTGKNQKSTTQ